MPKKKPDITTDLNKRLDAARLLIPQISKNSFASIDDPVTGAFAAYLTKGQNAAIVMVCPKRDLLKDVGDLKTMLNAEGISKPKIILREPNVSYICLKRLENARKNGHQIPDSFSMRLRVASLPPRLRSLAQVQSCSRTCILRNECQFAAFLARIKNAGNGTFIAISEEEFAVSSIQGELPRVRIIIRSAATANGYADQFALRRRDLRKTLIQTEMLCGTEKKKKETIRKITHDVKTNTEQLFDDSSLTRNQALNLIGEIHKALHQIQQLCRAELVGLGPERAAWRQNLNHALEVTSLRADELFEINSQILTVIKK